MLDCDDGIDVMVTSPVFIDMELFTYWIRGWSIQDVSLALLSQGVAQKFFMTQGMLQADVRNHFVQFQLLETAMHNPPAFLTDSSLHQIDYFVRLELIQKYYEFDEKVARELLGKKLSSRDRRHDCDEISERTGIPLRSCRRQFDNMKRVLKQVEDMSGSLLDNIKTSFRLNEVSAPLYAAFVFISNNRFDIGKRKLSFLTFEDFAFCASQLMSNWSCRNKDIVTNDEETDLDFDSSFFHDLKDLKFLADKKDIMDEHKNLLLSRVRQRVSDRVHQDIDHNFRNYSKAIVSIACGLNHSRDLRDFFVDISEKLLDPFKNADWSIKDVEMFLIAYREMAKELPAFGRQPQLLKIWEKYLIPLGHCIRKMFHS